MDAGFESAGKITVKNVEELRKLDSTVKVAFFGDREFTRHTNRNGDTGGFVERTASAGPDTYVGAKALVLDRAEMHKHSMAYGSVTLCENSALDGYARLYGEGSIMRGNSVGCDDAHIAEFVVAEGDIVLGGHMHAYGMNEIFMTRFSGWGKIDGDPWIYNGVNWKAAGEPVNSSEHFKTQEQVDAFLNGFKKDKLRGQEQVAGTKTENRESQESGNPNPQSLDTTISQNMGGQSM